MLVGTVGGCAKPAGEVEGIVTLDGKPVRGVVVNFLPDYDAGANGLPSQGATDENGRYSLAGVSKVQPGVFVGKHIVRCETPPFRLPNARLPDAVPGIYASSETTPLRFEVTEGKQTIDIRLTSQHASK